MVHPESGPATKETMLSHYRHELRTPINAIIGYSEMWLEETLTPATVADLRQVREAGRQLLAAVNAVVRTAAPTVLRPDTAVDQAEVDPARLGRALRVAMQAPLATVDSQCRRLLADLSGSGQGDGPAADLRKILQAGHQLAALIEDPAAHIVLPPAPGPAGEADRAPAATSAAAAPRGGETLLIVDDNPINSELLSSRLQRMGYTTRTAAGGEAALRLIESQRFDLVLLDVVMPGISGIDVLRQVRRTHSVTDLPVIMVTARDESDEIVTALEAGANDYVTKPVSLPVLSARARTQLLLKQMVTALEAANQQLEDLSFRDGLTQIANRRRFDEYLDAEWKRAVRQSRPLSVLLIDIDFFKPYNDTYGHEAGDAVLKRVAATLAQSVARSTDLVARYGGEEFAAVLPSTDAPGTLLIAERMRDRVRALAIPHAGSQSAPYLSVSIGGATCHPQRGVVSPATLVRAADTLLYAAKRAGRNRVCVSAPEADRVGG